MRTLILGIDYDGRIVQHDRNAAQILARKPEDLLGAQLIELTSGPHGNHAAGDQAQPNSHAARPIELKKFRSDALAYMVLLDRALGQTDPAPGPAGP